MIETTQGLTHKGQEDWMLKPAAPGTQKQADSETQVPDFKVSFQQDAVETLTYCRTGTVYFQSVGAPSFEDMLSKLLQRQGVTYEEAMGGKTVEIDPETKAEAQGLIAEDGYWGINKTSERIFQFGVAGADPAKRDEIKAAISKGFDMAKAALGGMLPEISLKTFDAVMNKLDDWAANTG